MKILLVDDSVAVRASFGELVRSIPDVEWVGAAGDVVSALSMIAAQPPDLVVLDVELRNGEHGIEVLRQVMQTRPGMQVIVLSNFSWRAMRTQLLAAGASAYFDKANEFKQALDWIAQRAAERPILPKLPPP